MVRFLVNTLVFLCDHTRTCGRALEDTQASRVREAGRAPDHTIDTWRQCVRVAEVDRELCTRHGAECVGLECKTFRAGDGDP